MNTKLTREKENNAWIHRAAVGPSRSRLKSDSDVLDL